MDLLQEWQNMSTEIITKDNHISTIKLDAESHGILQSVLFKLKWKLRWIRIIDIPLLIAILFTKGDLRTVLIAMFVVYEIFRAFGVNEYNKIKTGVDYSSNTKQLLEGNLKAIKKMLAMENLFGYTFLPIAGPIGLLAYNLAINNSFKNVFSEPKFFLISGLFVLFCIPAIVITKRINDKLFAQHIKDLSAKISQLSD